MKLNSERWVDAAISIFQNKELPYDDLVNVVHDETGVPKVLIVDAMYWYEHWGDKARIEAASKRLQDYFDEDLRRA